MSGAQIGSRDSLIPIIMLTARGEEADRIVGLELGADDYVTKPFSPRELTARVAALLRRAQRHTGPGALRYGTLVIDVDRHTVHVDGAEVRLTAKEFLLLLYLVKHRGRVLSRDCCSATCGAISTRAAPAPSTSTSGGSGTRFRCCPTPSSRLSSSGTNWKTVADGPSPVTLRSKIFLTALIAAAFAVAVATASSRPPCAGIWRSASSTS